MVEIGSRGAMASSKCLIWRFWRFWLLMVAAPSAHGSCAWRQVCLEATFRPCQLRLAQDTVHRVDFG
ncbi:hypothetical protein A2U01_0081211 [Trifolium medium]|uniref:Secreted protein n=1 Tax=Trifolium medium TaxID=97028 RepID=A0A392TIL3_9FABA|nr:hypothetical protein [Trifolium medium]